MMESLEHVGASPGADPQIGESGRGGVQGSSETGGLVTPPARPGRTAPGGPTDRVKSGESADRGSNSNRLTAGARMFGAI
jgi:hypothetical protein